MSTTINLAISPPYHWYSVVSLPSRSVNVTTINYYNGTVYMVLRDSGNPDNAFILVGINATTGYPITLNGYKNITYFATGIGMIRASTVDEANGILYLGSSNGYIVGISLSDYSVVSANKITVTGETVNDIRFISIDPNGYMSIAIRGANGVYSTITDFSSELWSAVSLSGKNIFWTLNDYNNLIYNLYYEDSAGTPVFSVINLKSSTVIGYNLNPLGHEFKDDVNYVVSYNPVTQTMALTAILRKTTYYYTMLYNISMSGTIYYSLNISQSGVSIEGVKALYPGNNRVYIYGAASVGTSLPDALYMECDPDAPSVIGWRIGGYGEDIFDNGNMATFADYYSFIGMNTKSFGFSSDYYSGAVALVSPGLASSDTYAWKTPPPSYSSPSAGAYAESISPSINKSDNPVSYSVRYSTVQVSQNTVTVTSSGGVSLNHYMGATTSTPLPVPEASTLAVIGVVLGLAAMYLVMRNRLKN